MLLKSGMEVRETVKAWSARESTHRLLSVSEKDEREGKGKTCLVPGP